uniref:Zinc finger protein 385B n=1 Tax=Cacopsylla melanoneura TaxID=428564 RepID=A0A8D8LWC9_9HEMI
MFPAVATVYGLSANEASRGFVATLALDQNSISSTPITTPVCPAHTPLNRKPIQNIISKMETSDPVTRAIIDNVAGNLPTKKVANPIKCEVCNIEVSGQCVLDSHIQGVKHKRKLALLAAQQGKQAKTETTTSAPTAKGGVKTASSINNGTFTTPSMNTVSSSDKVFPCTVCNITVNSAEQLEIHKGGKQHKKKSDPNYANNNPKPDSTKTVAPETEADDSPLPENVTKKVEGNVTIYTCTMCDKWVNSRDQLNMHLKSRKHDFKLRGVFGQRFAPYDAKKRIAKDTFGKFRSGGVLGQDRRGLGVRGGARGGFNNNQSYNASNNVQYPSYNANVTPSGDYGFNTGQTNTWLKKNTATGARGGYGTSRGNNNSFRKSAGTNNSYGYNTNSGAGTNNAYGYSTNSGNSGGTGTSTYDSVASAYGFSSEPSYCGSSYAAATGAGPAGGYGDYAQSSKTWSRGQYDSYGYDKITPSKAKNYFNAATSSQPVYQTQDNFYPSTPSY